MSYIRPLADGEIEMPPDPDFEAGVQAIRDKQAADAATIGGAISDALSKVASFFGSGTIAPTGGKIAAGTVKTAAAPSAAAAAPSSAMSKALPMLLVGGVLLGAVALMARKAHKP